MLPARVPPDAARVARARPRRPLGQAHVNRCLCFIDSLCHSTAPAFFRARVFLAVCSLPHRNVLVRGGQRSPSLHRQERRDDDRASAGGHEPAPRRARERHRPRRSGTRAQPRHPSHTPLPGRARARDARPATADGGRRRWRSVPAFLILFVLNRATGGAILRVHASSRAPRDVCLSPAVRRPAPNPPPNPPRAAAATPPRLVAGRDARRRGVRGRDRLLDVPHRPRGVQRSFGAHPRRNVFGIARSRIARRSFSSRRSRGSRRSLFSLFRSGASRAFACFARVNRPSLSGELGGFAISFGDRLCARSASARAFARSIGNRVGRWDGAARATAAFEF